MKATIRSHHLSHFLKYHASLIINKERSSFYQFPASKKISLYSQKTIISIFLLFKKFIKSFSLLNMDFAFVQSSCSCNNISSFHRNLFLLTILKGLKPFNYKVKHDIELGNFLFSDISMVTT